MPARPMPPPPLDRPLAGPVAVAAEMLVEFGGAVCPSLSAALERLIDRHAAGRAEGAR